MIAGLPKAPWRFNPIANPEQAVARRNHVLPRTLELGHIGREEHDEARDAPVATNATDCSRSRSKSCRRTGPGAAPAPAGAK